MNQITPEDIVDHIMKKHDSIIVDTRSPAEFAADHLPGAINIPIFDNDQRALIGIQYKEDKDKAYEVGFNIYKERLPLLTKRIEEEIQDKDTEVVVYCWRGGLRSKTFCELVESLGYNTFQLEDGYKGFREVVRERLYSFKPSFKFVVLYGLAGNGKTDILKEMKKQGIQSIDLEGFAQHRSSIFGAIGLKPNSQKRFETKLYFELQRFEQESKEEIKHVFIEGESRKIGDLFIPDNIFKAMKEGIAIRINCPIELRAKRIVRDYFTHNEDDTVINHILSLKDAMGKKRVTELIDLYTKGDTPSREEVARVLLVDYYDPKYEYMMDQIRFSKRIENVNLSDSIKNLLLFCAA